MFSGVCGDGDCGLVGGSRWMDGLVGGLNDLRWKQVCFSSGYGFVEVS